MVMSFGKYKNYEIKNIPVSYLHWLIFNNNKTIISNDLFSEILNTIGWLDMKNTLKEKYFTVILSNVSFRCNTESEARRLLLNKKPTRAVIMFFDGKKEINVTRRFETFLWVFNLC